MVVLVVDSASYSDDDHLNRSYHLIGPAMSDSDSDLGFFPTIMRRVRRKVSLGTHSLEVDTDEESLYETMPQKLKSVVNYISSSFSQFCITEISFLGR